MSFDIKKRNPTWLWSDSFSRRGSWPTANANVFKWFSDRSNSSSVSIVSSHGGTWQSLRAKHAEYVKRDLYVSKETYVYESRHIKETYQFLTGQTPRASPLSTAMAAHGNPCVWSTPNTSKQTSKCQQKPIHIKDTYGVATVSRIDKIIGLFCRISSLW